MLIAQITDIHLGFDKSNPNEFNRQRLDRLIAHLHEDANRPDVLVVTGDLVDHGEPVSYARLADALSPCEFPVHLCVGNHDRRAPFAAQFPQVPTASGFVQYATDLGGMRLIVLDTLEEGRHAGAFCEVRADWLRARLAEAPATPTLIAMHHPPVEVGIEWMNTAEEEPWVARFSRALEGFDQVKAIICGHVHRPIVTMWHGKAVSVCASSAPQVALNFCPIDPDHPDNRAMIVAEPPGCAFHRWNGHALITHFDIAEQNQTLARYNAKLQPLVRALINERPSAIQQAPKLVATSRAGSFDREPTVEFKPTFQQKFAA